MNESVLFSQSASEKVELSVRLDPALLDQIKHLTNDPSKVIEVAVRQWLKNELRRDDELTRNLQRNPPVPPRGEWNDWKRLASSNFICHTYSDELNIVQFWFVACAYQI